MSEWGAASSGRISNLPRYVFVHVWDWPNIVVVVLCWTCHTAAGFGSKNKYLFGSYGVKIKLPPNDSAGTVTTFYVKFSALSTSIIPHVYFWIDFRNHLGHAFSHSPNLAATRVHMSGLTPSLWRLQMHHNTCQQLVTWQFLWLVVCSSLLMGLTTMSLTLSFWGIHQGSLTSSTPIFTPMASVARSSNSLCGLTQLLISTPTMSSGTRIS